MKPSPKRCPRCSTILQQDGDGDYFCPGTDLDECSFTEFREQVHKELSDEEVDQVLDEAGAISKPIPEDDEGYF